MKSKFLAWFSKLRKVAQSPKIAKDVKRLPLQKSRLHLQLAKVAKVFRVFAPGWALLTEVPGWADAPFSMRVRRSLPIVAPSLAIVLIVGWNHLVRLPQIQSVYRKNQPLLNLERDVSALRQACSDQQAAELAAKADAATLLLVEESDLPGILRGLKKSAAEQGWDATFQASDHSGETVAEGAPIVYLPVRAKLSAKAASGQAFPGLLTFLDQLSSSPKRIDLMRLAIRADEQGRYFVELNLRLVCRVAAHEKTS